MCLDGYNFKTFVSDIDSDFSILTFKTTLIRYTLKKSDFGNSMTCLLADRGDKYFRYFVYLAHVFKWF